MTIIVVPTEKCNLRCRYCFEPEDQRIGFDIQYDFEKIKSSLLAVWAGPYNGSDVCLHGGEPTLIGATEFERLLDLIFNLPWKCGDGSIQPKGAVSLVTNATLIDDNMIRLFKKYNVYPAVSVDGPPELNVLRGPNPESEVATREYNDLIWKNIKKMRDAGLPVSIMCILHKGNASTVEQLQKLGNWLLKLRNLGITQGRLNPAYSDNHPEIELTNDELYRAYNYFYRVNKRYNLGWNPLREMESNLKEHKNSPCHFIGCDKFATPTLSIHPDGTIGNCDRTFSDGLYLRSQDRSTSGRYLALKQTQCRGCKYWTVCYGTCPQEGVGGDWRNKTRFCGAIYKTYSYIEKKIREETPGIELVVDNLEAVSPMEIPGNTPHGDEAHGDSKHGDQAHGDSGHGDSYHGDAPHGDAPHGDSHHGDSPDWRN
jgi:radical SAM protein with 4Fe4S-binding SPASM domain